MHGAEGRVDAVGEGVHVSQPGLGGGRGAGRGGRRGSRRLPPGQLRGPRPWSCGRFHVLHAQIRHRHFELPPLRQHQLLGSLAKLLSNFQLGTYENFWRRVTFNITQTRNVMETSSSQ